MFLYDLMQNPIVSVVITIFGIFGTLFGIVSFVISRKKSQLSYLNSTNILIKDNVNKISELELMYKKNLIKNISITKTALWNKGNKTINYSDVVASQPIELFCDEGVDILDVFIILESEKSNMFSIIQKDKNSFIVKFDYAEPKNGIIIQIIHTGNSNSIKMRGKIKGGKDLLPKHKNKSGTWIGNLFAKGSNKVLLNVLYIIQIVLFILITLAANFVILYYIVNSRYLPVADKWFKIIFLIAIDFLVVFICSIAKKMILPPVPFALRSVNNHDID